MPGTTEGARKRFRQGRDWPDRCEGPGKYRHQKGCSPARPKCKWRRRSNPRYCMCECGIPHYPHRIGTTDWRNGCCQHNPEAERINYEMIELRDWESGEALEASEVCSARYR